MARITVEDCINKFESRFELVLVASNRARKLHSGENQTVEKNIDKNTVIALREIADETILIEDMKNSLVEEYQTVSSHDEENLSPELTDSENYKDNINDQEQIYATEEEQSTELLMSEEVNDNQDDLNIENEQNDSPEKIEEGIN